ncbi:hypothetical protein HG531_003227 [Fusarium graminearum]|nr:hypothetical protein HG531_003227 [Fusarium graminearum]
MSTRHQSETVGTVTANRAQYSREVTELAGVLGLPAVLCGNELSSPLTASKHRHHGVDSGHLGEDTGIDNSELVDAANLELRVDNSHLIPLGITHLSGTGRVVDSVGDATGVLANLLVGLNLGARGNFLLEPLLEGALLGDLTGGLDTMNKSSRIVPLRIGEVAEVKSGLDSRVSRGQVDATTRARTRNVGCHAESVTILDLGVSKTLCVEVEGDLVAVHHDIGSIAVVASGILRLTSKEDTCIRVHGGLVGRDSLVQLPHDDGLGVIEKVLANTGDVLDNGDVERLKLSLGANTRVKEESGCVDGTGAKDGLLASMESVLLAGLQGNVDACSDIVLDKDLGDMGLGKNRQVGASLIASEDRVDISDGSTAAVAGVGVVRDGEEAGTLGQLALL